MIIAEDSTGDLQVINIQQVQTIYVIHASTAARKNLSIKLKAQARVAEQELTIRYFRIVQAITSNKGENHERVC